MAESKSDQFINNINTHSEKIAKSDPLSINRLLADSECDQCDRSAFAVAIGGKADILVRTAHVCF